MSMMERPTGGARVAGARFEFRVAERLSATALAAFPELRAVDPTAASVLRGYLRDRSELLAIIERLDLLGLTILEVRRLPA